MVGGQLTQLIDVADYSHHLLLMYITAALAKNIDKQLYYSAVSKRYHTYNYCVQVTAILHPRVGGRIVALFASQK